MTDSSSGPARDVAATDASTPSRVLRFDRVERAAHWMNALLFGILMATALPLYFAQVESIIGRRALIAEIHVWAGVALPIPLIISLAGPWGARFRRDLRRVNVWTRAEIRWLRSFGVQRLMRPDKFNPGQKLNAIFTGGAIVIMLGTGSILKWFRFFPVEWRTGATFVHDLLAAMIFAVVFGHIAFALTHPDALRSMFKGSVSEAWAKRHAGGWLEELREDEVATPAVSVGRESAESTSGDR
jgi:formate dehydrogenase subunit gamma